MSDTFVNTCKTCGSNYDQSYYEKNMGLCEECGEQCNNNIFEYLSIISFTLFLTTIILSFSCKEINWLELKITSILMYCLTVTFIALHVTIKK